MQIRMPKNKVPTSEDVRRLRKKIAELKGDVEKLERRKEERIAEFGTVPYRVGMGNRFYSTTEWRELRFQVLKENAKKNGSKAKCEQCGASAGERPLEVDHCKPRSLFPHLELVKHNLQVLCHDCNQGKGSSI